MKVGIYIYPIIKKKKTVNILNRLIFIFVFSIFATIFYTMTPDLVFSSGIDHMINSTDTQPKSSSESKKFALIENTFTYTAYQNGSFYNFYDLYGPEMFDRAYNGLNTTITDNLYLLKDKPIPHRPFPFYLHPEYNDIPYIKYAYLIENLVQKNNQSWLISPMQM